MKNLTFVQKALRIGIAALVVIFATPLPPVLAEYNSMLAPTNFTPTTYIPPKYDAFDHDYYYAPKDLPEREPDVIPVANFNIYSDQRGLQNSNIGTIETIFTFDASASTDIETTSGLLEARWDFESDGTVDSYFSRTKAVRHQFKKAGTYLVQLQVLDLSGNISSTAKSVTVVENTAPVAYFSYKPVEGTEQSIFTFNTEKSRDDQYLSGYLVFRFDWDGDSQFDTKYEGRTIWSHRFNTAGTHHVVMEAKDPAGLTAQTYADITTTANTAPQASFTVRRIDTGSNAGYTFEVNAFGSTDQETATNHLKFRWDFNHGGPNDIIYDTSFSTSYRTTFRYEMPGTHTIKLEVMDEDGVIASTFAAIEVH